MTRIRSAWVSWTPHVAERAAAENRSALFARPQEFPDAFIGSLWPFRDARVPFILHPMKSRDDVAALVSDELRKLAEEADLPFHLDGVCDEESTWIFWGSFSVESETLDIAVIRLALLVLDDPYYRVPFMKRIRARFRLDDWEDMVRLPLRYPVARRTR